jgi:hypothetical protein
MVEEFKYWSRLGGHIFPEIHQTTNVDYHSVPTILAGHGLQVNLI